MKPAIHLGRRLLQGPDATEHQRAEAEVRRVREQLELAQRSAGAGMWDWDVRTGHIEWSRELYELFGMDPERSQAGFESWAQALHPEDREPAAERTRIAVRDHSPLNSEYRVVLPGGQIRWINALGRTICDAAGQPVRMSGICLDITAKKDAELRLRSALAEKEALLREVHHRVKNNLQVVSSLLHLQAVVVEDEAFRHVLLECQGRLKAMGLVHEKLYESASLAHLDFEAYVKGLAVDLFRAWLPPGCAVGFRAEVARAPLELSTAITCGLLIHELASNALKHGFCEGPAKSGQEIAVFLEDAGVSWRLTVADNGKGMPEGADWRRPRTLGLRLVQMLVQQLRGGIRLGTGAGCQWIIDFPKQS